MYIDSPSFLIILMSSLFLAGCLLTPIAARMGAPFLLLFLCIGMLVGVDGIGGIRFNDFPLAYEIGAIALALILFSGGLDTDSTTLKKAAAPAFILAIVGVILTSGIVGILIHFIFDIDLDKSLLLGAVVGSTDAAATFLILRQRNIKLRNGLGETLMVEAGINDPVAIFLTIMMVAIVDAQLPLSLSTLVSFLPELASQLGLGIVGGVVGGYGAAILINRINMPVSLYAPFAMATALLIFNLTSIFDGSGFLAVYICGVILRYRMKNQTERVGQFHDGLSWISQIVLFLMLGLLVTPSSLLDTIPMGLVVAAILMFLARPIATYICLTPFRMNFKDQTFLGWVGLRGAVPIFLAIIPVISSGPVDESFFNIVFVVVIASLFLQGWSISLVARWLGLIEKPAAEEAAKD
ncbi:potassium/proton antiporter [Sneathiella marina]|uniref:Potassium/proton antiporter n=1 Tax=Sneathiella marina TaxID=2950108 RepID=A0ABY4W6F1_9PROT|nr:potassium/proton antiporter [Sneathiella marina]USG62745.1 potassium/proton antiporter [Sneathiella marina]